MFYTNGASPLWIASANGNVAMLEVLIEAGGNVNQHGNKNATPLFMASKNVHIDIVRRLLQQPHIDIHKNPDGYSAIGMATKNNHTEIVIAITTLCVGGLVASMNILPSFIRWLGIRGAKAPLWLEDLLVETDGHVPRPRDGNEYRKFLLHKYMQYRMKNKKSNESKCVSFCSFCSFCS